MESFKKIGANVVFQGFGRLITASASLLVTILVAQTFGPSSLGDLTKVLSFVVLFYLIVDFGFNAIVVKDICKDEGKTSFYLSNLFSLRIALSLVLIILVFLVTLFLPFNLEKNTGFSPWVKAGIILASLTILTQAVIISANSLFQARLRYDKSTLALFFGSLTTVFLTVIFLNYAFFSWPQSLQPVVFAYIFGAIISSLLAFSFVRKEIPDFGFTIDLNFWKKLLIRTWPIGLTLIFNLIYFRVDMLILALVRSSSEVGLYSLSYKVFDLALVFPIFLINASYPVMVGSLAQNKKELLKFSKKILAVLLIVSLLTFLVIFIFSPQIIKIIGGESFFGSISSLRILVLGLPVFYLSAFLMWLLIIFEDQKLLIFIYSFGAFLNILLNIIFIPQFGYLAAAATTGVSEFVILLFSSFFVIRKFKTA